MHHCTIAPKAQSRKHHCTSGATAFMVSSMVDQPDPVIRKTVSLPTSVWKEIEDFQFANRVKRDSEAIRRLIEAGLKAVATEKPNR
jgi:hypothetical protein